MNKTFNFPIYLFICNLYISFRVYRSCHRKCSMKKGVLKNFAKITRKRLCQSLYFNKVATLSKKRFWHKCFPVNFVKFLRAPIFIEHFWWLLLDSFISKYVNSHAFSGCHPHFRKLTPPLPSKKFFCLISPSFIASHPPKNHFAGNISGY